MHGYHYIYGILMMKIVILTVTPVTVEYYGSLVVPDTWNPKLEDTGSQEYQLFVTQLSNGVSTFQPFIGKAIFAKGNKFRILGSNFHTSY